MFRDDDYPAFEVAWIALQSADFPKLEELASKGTFPHGVDDWLGRRWLTNAIDTCNADSVDWVLGQGVECNYIEDEVFCALESALGVLESALGVEDSYDRTAPKTRDPEVAVALTIRIIDALVKAGVDVNQQLTRGGAALHVAARWSSPIVVRHLLALKADPFSWLEDLEQGRPADIAKWHKRWEVHAVLCKAMGVTPAGRPI